MNARKTVFIVLLLAVASILFFGMYGTDVRISFSVENGFISQDVVVELNTSFSLRKHDIYYTLDGSEPTVRSAKYIGGIALTCGDEVSLYTIKAKTIDGEREGKTFIRSYFVGRNVYDRFANMVFVLTTDPDNLYGYENGIFVEGKLRDDWIRNNPGKEITERTPANYTIRGKASEREAYVEIFESDGTRVSNQYMNMRISGSVFSRNLDQVSLKLFARTDSGKSVVQYPFFKDRTSVASGETITQYTKLWLRTGSQDFRATFLKDVIAGQLALNAGVVDASHSRPAAVYVNSRYYGYANLQELIDESYLYSNYGGVKGNYTMAESQESRQLVNYGDTAFNDKLARLYGLFDADLNDERVFSEIQKNYDLDQFMFYYCFLIYINSPDSVNNNYVTWTYNNEKHHTVNLGSKNYLDGKWRPIIKDHDVSLGFFRYDLMRAMLLGESLGGESGNDDIKPSKILTALIRREDMRNQFINTLLDQMNHYLNPEAITKVVDEKYRESKNEIYHYIQSDANDKDIFNEASFEEEIDKMRAFAKERPGILKQSLEELFGIVDVYQLAVKKSDMHIVVNSIDLAAMDGDYVGEYYGEVPVSLTCLDTNGKRFEKWLVNGKAYYDREIHIAQEHIDHHSVTIEVLCS